MLVPWFNISEGGIVCVCWGGGLENNLITVLLKQNVGGS